MLLWSLKRTANLHFTLSLHLHLLAMLIINTSTTNHSVFINWLLRSTNWLRHFIFFVISFVHVYRHVSMMCVCVCSMYGIWAYVCMVCMSFYAGSKGHWVLSYITLCLILLRQGISLNLRQSWWPQTPSILMSLSMLSTVLGLQACVGLLLTF